MYVTRVLIIADDLTGANDSAVQFAERGFGAATILVRGNESSWAGPLAVEVIAASTESRNSPAMWAAERAFRISSALISEYSPDIIFKKVDSTLRGNPGAETAATARALGTKVRAVIAPAYPENGRTVKSGRLYVNGKPLEETYAARDPLAPVRSSLVADYFEETSSLPGVTVEVADAARSSDLDLLVDAGSALDHPILWIGSAGLASALARYLDKDGMRGMHDAGGLELASSPPPAPANGERILGLFGSLNPVTIEQVEMLAKEGACRVILPASAEELGRSGIAELAGLTGGTGDVVVATYRVGTGSDDPARACDGIKTAGLIKSFIGEAARQAALCGQFGTLVMAGGDIAYAALNRLQVQAIRIVKEIIPGVVFGIAVGGIAPGMRIVTKAGGFGGPKSLLEVFGWLRSQKG